MRSRLLNHIKDSFKTREAAKEHYNLTLSGCLEEMDKRRDIVSKTPVKLVDKVTQTVSSQQIEDADAQIESAFDLNSLVAGMDCAQLNKFSNIAFAELAIRKGINSNPANFAERAVQAMRHHQVNGKNNLLYKFAQCIAIKRNGQITSHLISPVLKILLHQMQTVNRNQIVYLRG